MYFIHSLIQIQGPPVGLNVTWIRMVQTTCPRPTLLQHHLTYHNVRSSHSSSVQVMHILKTLSCTSSPSLSRPKRYHIAAVHFYQFLLLACAIPVAVWTIA